MSTTEQTTPPHPRRPRRPRRRKDQMTVYDTLKLDQAVEEYLLSTAMLSDQTQRWYRYKLYHLAEWVRLRVDREPLVTDLTTHLLREYLATLTREGSGLLAVNRDAETPLSSRTIKGYYQVVKTFTRWLRDEELLEVSPIDRIKTPKVQQDVIETFTPEHLRGMMTAAKRTTYPLRNLAIVNTLLETGIRASELCNLRMEHLSLSRNDALLRVVGKGRKERELPIGMAARLPLYRYITRERPLLLGDHTDPGTVFLSYGGKRMQPHGLYAVIDSLGEMAHVTGVRCSPHTFRHTYALSYLRQGGRIYNLSRLLGHADVKVTEVYLRDYQLEDARADGISVVGSLYSESLAERRRRR